MPTRIATLGREKRIATLARKVFTIDGPDSAELRIRAEAALLKANPQLARKEAFRAGAVIVVPRITGLWPTPEVAVARADTKGLSNEATLRLKVIGARMEQQFRNSQEKTRKTLALVDSAEFLTEIRKALPDALPLIESARAEIEKREGEFSEKNTKLQAAISKAIEEVETLQAIAERARNG